MIGLPGICLFIYLFICVFVRIAQKVTGGLAKIFMHGRRWSNLDVVRYL